MLKHVIFAGTKMNSKLWEKIMRRPFHSIARCLSLSAFTTILAVSAVTQSRADLLTYNVNFTYDPNSSPSSSLNAAGPGTVTGTFTIDTTIPINSPTQTTGTQVTNLVSADLFDASNNSTPLSGAYNSPTYEFNTVTPYVITFIGSPTTIIPNSSELVNNGGQLYELVDFSSPPVIDTIQEGPSLQFDFPYPSGGPIIPGNFDSITNTAFNSYLFGTVTLAPAPEPTVFGLTAIGSLCLIARRRRQTI
jgi:hypothetical protein